MVKLFGFKLTDTSALLMFLLGIGLVFTGTFGILVGLMYYNTSGYIMAFQFVIFGAFLGTGLYILSKSLKHRDK